MSEVLDFVVVGAGISGLSTAFEFKQQGLKGTVLESAPGAGGCVATVNHFDLYPELGAHSVFNSYQGLISIIEALGLGEHILEQKKLPFLLWDSGNLSSVVKKLRFTELLMSLPKMIFSDKTSGSVSEYYGRIVGTANFNSVIVHALNAVACQDISKAPAKFLFQKRTRNRTYAKKFSFSHGLGFLIDKLASALDVKYATEVSDISQNNDKFVLRAGDKEFVTKRLVLATPPQVSVGLLAELDQDLAAVLAKINETRFYSVGISVKKKHIAIEECAGWIGKDASFHSMISNDPVNQSSTNRAFTFHFKPDAGTGSELTVQALEFLGINSSQALTIDSKLNTLPKISSDHYQLLAEIEPGLKDKAFGLVGNYFNGMSLEDCIQRALSESKRLSNQGS